MRGRSIAKRYAKGIMASALKLDRVDEFARELATLNKTLADAPPEVGQFLKHPQVEREKKQALIEQISGEKISPAMLRLTAVLLKRSRLPLLGAIETEYFIIKRQHEGFQTVTVESKRELSISEEKRLTATLEKFVDGKVILEKTIDPSIIGGLRVYTGGKMIDGTVNGQFETMREKLIDHISED
ncbi:MAG: ATP synthase F1 subunit delta [bacterium]|nr:ATP synthase F1 subunit delta [bacterium]